MNLSISLLSVLLVSAVWADRPQWRKIDGDLAQEPEIQPLQEVDESYRLPNVAVPSHYNLNLRTSIHVNNREFQGIVEIFFDLLQNSDKVTVHNRQLSISSVSLFSVVGGQNLVDVAVMSFETDARTEHLTIQSENLLQQGSYMVRIQFTGRLQNNNNQGFFASSYLDNDGQTHYIASNKFEPHHARSAFPCFDEPKLKASFSLSLTHHKDYHSVANMPQDGMLLADSQDPDFVVTRFQRSTVMSTYLVAFAVTNFAIRTKGAQTVYARPNVFEETEYPLDAGIDILNALGDYLGISYINHMPKMTQIAIPDRGTGAMENWGLVAYGEPVLLFNPAINSYRTKKSVTTIIAHEYAHQWFGNLVSPDWWTYIWLNEGFATVYEYLAATLAYPENDYWALWNVEVIHSAFAADARETVRPMNWNAGSPNEIAGLFDTVAYDKSGSVLNMFREVMGDANWRLGLTDYLNRRKLNVATDAHLYEGLQVALNAQDIIQSALSIQQLMESWTNAPGFPLLTVRRDYQNGVVYLSQERFLSDRVLPNTHVYHIPYNYATKSNADFSTQKFDWLSSKAEKISTTASADDWIIFNNQQTGYYRVNYDLQNWKLIINALLDNPEAIHVQNRAQLINDAFNLARADRLDMALALELLTYLKKENTYPPWAAASTVLTYFNNKFRGTPYYEPFVNFAREILTPIYATLPIDSVPQGETMLQKYLKQTISTWACRVGVQDCLNRAARVVSQAVSDKKPAHPDISTTMYCFGLQNAGEAEYVWIYEWLLASKNQAERAVLIDAMGCSQNKEFLIAFLETSILGGFNFLETERTRIVMSVYAGSRIGVDALIEFLMMEDALVDEFISRLGQNTLNNAIANIAVRTNNGAELTQLETLLARLGSKVSAATATSARNTVANNFAWFTTFEGLVSVEFYEPRTVTHNWELVNNLGVSIITDFHEIFNHKSELELWTDKFIDNFINPIVLYCLRNARYTVSYLAPRRSVENFSNIKPLTRVLEALVQLLPSMANHLEKMGLRKFLFCALLFSVVWADRPQWRKIDGDLAPEVPIQPLQEIDESYLLPRSAVPSHYNLNIKTSIHENNREFQGNVEIFFELLQSSDKVIVHNRQLSIWNVRLFSVVGEQNLVELGLPAFETDTRTEHLIIQSESLLEPGSYMVRIQYTGRLQNNNNVGFYASSYVDNDGNRHYIASTKLESTNARMAFPCFDEPQLKASFSIALIHHKDYHAVANMPQEGNLEVDTMDPDYVVTRFQKSTVMSTFLVAFAVTNFAIRTRGTQTVYARPNVFEETEYPLDAGIDILEALGDYLGIPYISHMPKMTQIAIPDRTSSAMENWGLVSYGEPVLLFNPAINSYRTKKSVTTIIAHEFAHQWFGNLVTPEWWTYVWLKEGFATVYEYLAATLAYPENDYWALWNVEVIHNAFAADARETVRPMNWNAGSPNEIAGLFDTVAYDKAGSVLNMFREVVGDENFRVGLSDYFNQAKLGVATDIHLYQGLQLALNGQDILSTTSSIQQLMESWTNAPGFPLLTVRRDYQNGVVYLSQERFLSDRVLPNTHVYHIPYNYATKSNADFSTQKFDWLSSKAEKISTTASAEDWIIFNNKQTGYYRVNYDLQNWKLILNTLLDNPETIHVQNRAQLINDAYNLARADRLDMALALELLTYLKKENTYPPWAAASTVLTYFNNKFRGTPYYEHFVNFAREILTPIYATLPIDSVPQGETMLQKYLKQTISTWACRVGVQDCLNRAARVVSQAVSDKKPAHPDISTAMYCFGLQNAGEAEYVWIYEWLLASKNQAERAVLIDAMGCSQNKEFLVSFLMTSIGGGSTFNFLEMERTRIVSSVYTGSRIGVDALIEFLMMEDALVDEFISRLGQNTLNNAIANIAARTNNGAELTQFETLLARLGTRVSAATATSARNTVANNFAWFTTLEGLVSVEFFERF
ncbi:uncharacterized protein LOC129758416 [Uranotaenia lowii]|uniref:uncharacterized protein LOC129758416 n=1 Tax=Uranotaenia lowii TaxID=190385 RepID=UPI00247A9519|nr:uncharacterized protein LOC129758416 [Uranotaenia lowii]